MRGMLGGGTTLASPGVANSPVPAFTTYGVIVTMLNQNVH